MFNNGGYTMGGMHGLWWIFWVVLIGLLVFFLWRRPSSQPLGSHEAPLDVLKRRLAGGEISPEDYEKRKALLERDDAMH